MAESAEQFDVQCIVVHHRAVQDLSPTISALLLCGVRNERLLIVDNSEVPAVLASVRALVPDGATVISVPNNGYAAAVNAGMSHFRDAGRTEPYTLVATHEVLPEPMAVRALRDVLDNDPWAGVAGPTLMNGNTAVPVCWSTGGTLSRWLNLPGHLDHGTAPSDLPVNAEPTERAWLDGAFCLYRTSVLDQVPLDERYFMYFEETDCHLRIRSAGFKVYWNPTSVVTQRSNGTPAFYLGRNLVLFQLQNARKSQMFASVVITYARVVARTFAHRAKGRGLDTRPWRDYLRGIWDAITWLRSDRSNRPAQRSI